MKDVNLKAVDRRAFVQVACGPFRGQGVVFPSTSATSSRRVVPVVQSL